MDSGIRPTPSQQENETKNLSYNITEIFTDSDLRKTSILGNFEHLPDEYRIENINIQDFNRMNNIVDIRETQNGIKLIFKHTHLEWLFIIIDLLSFKLEKLMSLHHNLIIPVTSNYCLTDFEIVIANYNDVHVYPLVNVSDVVKKRIALGKNRSEIHLQWPAFKKLHLLTI